MGLLEDAFKLFGDFVEISAERNELHKRQVAIQERQLALVESKSAKAEMDASVAGCQYDEAPEAPIAVETDRVPTEVEDVVEDEKEERKLKVAAIKAVGRYEEVKGCGMKKVREVFDSLGDEPAEMDHPSLFPEAQPAVAPVAEAPAAPAPAPAPVVTEPAAVEPQPAPAASIPTAGLLDEQPAAAPKTFTKDEVKEKLLAFQAANGDAELKRIITDIGMAATFGQIDPVNYSKVMAAMGVEV